MPSKCNYTLNNNYPREQRDSKDDVLLKKLLDERLPLTSKRVIRIKKWSRMFECDLLKAKYRISMVEAILKQGR